MGRGKLLDDLLTVLRGEATGVLELELAEMESLFALLVVGSLVGLPFPPAPVGLSVLPHVEHEVGVLVSRTDGLDDMLATLLGRLKA
jgi:hypothetical protein